MEETLFQKGFFQEAFFCPFFYPSFVLQLFIWRSIVKIDKVARMLPDSKIRITGHTDSIGNNEFNKRLSLERAKAIAIYLNEKRAIQASRMEISGVGESKPIASNETTEGRKLNRRIEITFLAP